MSYTLYFWTWGNMIQFCKDHKYFCTGSNRNYDDLYQIVEGNGLTATPLKLRKAAEMIVANSRDIEGLDVEEVIEQIDHEVVEEIEVQELEQVDAESLVKALNETQEKLETYLEKMGIQAYRIELQINGQSEKDFKLQVHWTANENPLDGCKPDEALKFAKALAYAAELADGFKYNGYSRIPY